jgi:hypothetical protein
MRYLAAPARAAIEDGMRIEEFAAKSGCSAEVIIDHLDAVGYVFGDER